MKSSIHRYLFLYMIKYTGIISVSVFCVMILLSAMRLEARVVQGVTGKGEAAVVGMTAEQCQSLALRRARAEAVEKAAGVNISSSTLVKNALLVSEFLKSYTHGFIVAEKVKWLPLTTLKEDEDSPPIPLYSVEIIADVMIPEEKADPGFFMETSIDRHVYSSGDNCVIGVKVSRDAHLAIFNLMADDNVAMLFPGNNSKKDMVKAEETFLFPPKDSGYVLQMVTLEGHQQDSEAFFIVAVPVMEGKAFTFEAYFSEKKSYSVPEFFKIYSRFADSAIEEVIPYEVRNREEE